LSLRGRLRRTEAILEKEIATSLTLLAMTK